VAQGTTGTTPAHDPLPHVPASAALELCIRRTEGAVYVALDADDRWESPLAPAAPGLAALVADAATGSAVALLDGEAVISTALLTVELLAVPRGGVISAVAHVDGGRGELLPDGHSAYVAATAVLRDGHGIEFGRALGWWARRPRRDAPLPQRPTPPPATTSGASGSTSGGDPLSRTLGLEGVTRDESGVGFRLASVGELRNRSDTLHGGVGALLAHHAAVASVDAGPAVPEVLSLSTHYHRAAGTDGGPVQVRGSRIRRGRTSAVAVGEVLAADGRPALTTTVTMALTRGPER
jgi:acyl-coenzyme A thioesterase PaaI-like protein